MMGTGGMATFHSRTTSPLRLLDLGLKVARKWRGSTGARTHDGPAAITYKSLRRSKLIFHFRHARRIKRIFGYSITLLLLLLIS